MIVFRARQGAGERESAIAAAQVEDERRRPAEQGREVDDSRRHFLECGLRPLRRVENLTRNRHAEFLFNAPSRAG